MMLKDEMQEYKYRNRNLLPCERTEKIKKHLEKAIALIDVEIMIQEIYSQSDFGTLNTNSYKEAKQLLEKAMPKIRLT